MRKPAPFMLILIFFLPVAVFAEGKVSSSFETDLGLYVIVFDVTQGRVTVNLPDDITVGDTISGTVNTEPMGQSEEERHRNADELNGYLFEIGKERTSVAEEVIKWTIPAALSREPIYLVLRDKNGEEVARAQIPFEIAPAAERTATPSAGDYQFPMIGQVGKPIWVGGPFDGNFNTTAIKIGGQKARLIAESPRKLIVETPKKVAGPTEIELKEGNLIMKRSFNNLRVVKINQGEAPLLSTPEPIKLKTEEETTEEGKNPIPSPTPLTEKPIRTEIENKEATKENTVTIPPTESGGEYTIQIGSFKTEKEAEETAEDLISKGYPAFVIKAQIPGKGTWYRARIGTFKTIKDAKIYMNKLRDLEPSMESAFITLLH
ncbi:MAG: hypothetical protein C4291_04575 [Candidatus Dadabacteria bacterium]